MSKRPYAQLDRGGWDIATEMERNRRTARPETYRGAFADLCARLDHAHNNEVSFNPRYWQREWGWHPQEITRFFRRLEAAGVIKIKHKGNYRTIVASKNNVSRNVSKSGEQCEQQTAEQQGPPARVVSIRQNECEQNVSKVPPPTSFKPLANANSSSAAPRDTCPHQEIIALYHEVLPELSRVVKWTPARQKMLRARWREDRTRQNLESWRRFFEWIRKSDFLMGRATTFRATLPWMIKEENFAKILEKEYHRARATTPPSSPSVNDADKTEQMLRDQGML